MNPNPKDTGVADFYDRKGTPFEHFRRVLSTNQKPGFRALDQSEASISAKYSASAKSVTEDPLEPIFPQWISKYANGLPIRKCHVI